MSAAPLTRCRSAAASARATCASASCPVERVTGVDGHRDHDPRAARELLAHDARRRECAVDAMRERQSARAHVERGELVGAVTDDGDAERLEPLQSEREIEHQLRARADDAHRVARDRLQVRGLVERALGAAVDAADPTGRHDRDAGARRDLHRCSDRGRAQATTRQHRGEVTQRDLRTVRSSASRASSASSAPTTAWPSAIAIVAGVEPSPRTSSSSARAAARFCGRGKPCAMTVDSSATTGPCAARAAATSGWTASFT